MSKWADSIKAWVPSLVACCAVILAGGYLFSRQAQAAAGIRELANIGAMLSSTALLVRSSTLSLADVEALEAREKELQDRMTDALEPSLVQAELMQAAKRAGLILREISPMRSGSPRTGRKGDSDAPRYRVLVSGSYKAIAGYMQHGCRQRLPVRVVECRLRRAVSSGVAGETRLTADLTVEAFQPHDGERGGSVD